MRLFRSEEHVDRWCEREGVQRGAILSLDTTWKLAQAWFGTDRRLPEWRRSTPDEIRELFDNLGLTGDFWRLT